MSTPTLTPTRVKTKTVSATKFAIAIACLGVAALAAAAVGTRTIERRVVDTTSSSTPITTPTTRSIITTPADTEDMEETGVVDEDGQTQEETEGAFDENTDDFIDNGADENMDKIEIDDENIKTFSFNKDIKIPLSIKSAKYGNWAIFNLDRQGKTFKVSSVRQQKYNVVQQDFFDSIFSRIPANERGSTREQIIRRNKRVVLSEPFIDSVPFITEDFSENGKISLVDYEVLDQDSIEVKIPIENYSDPFELVIRNTETNKSQMLVSEKESRDWLKKLSNKSFSAGGLLKLASKNASSLCDDLKPVVLGHNKKEDKNRTNVIFIGFCYPDKDSFVQGLSYDLDLDGKGLKFKKTDKITGETIWSSTSTFGLFSVMPFSTNKDRFNFWYVDKTYIPDGVSCSTSSCNCKFKDYKSAVYALKDDCGLLNVKVEIMRYTTLDSGDSKAKVPGLWATISTKPYDDYKYSSDYVAGEELKFDPFSTKIFIHEWGHQFGGLADEYIAKPSKDKHKYPNCSKTVDQGKSWWLDLFPNMTFESGCSYSTANWKFFHDGIMDSSNSRYGDINELYLCKKIFDASGEVGGDCDKFFPEVCDDGKDNNLNSKTDCDDMDCAKHYKCGGVEDLCVDGIDNDGNGKIDCKDKNCQKQGCKEFFNEVAWQEWKSGEATSGSDYVQYSLYCHDGVDNDFNGKTDCNDLLCQNALGGCETKCADGKDNDGDKFIDCEDPDCDAVAGPGGKLCKYQIPSHEIAVCGGTQTLGCFTNSNLPKDWEKAEKKNYFCEVYSGIGDAVSQTIKAESPQKAAEGCCTYLSNFLIGGGYYTNALHNKTIYSSDAATAIDFYDCMALESKNCANNIDDDGDGKIDCADANCAGVYVTPKSMCEPGKEKQCSDGFDNDKDGKMDCKDSDCACFQTKETKCKDGLDNDGNGKTDCTDLNCQKNGCTEWANEVVKVLWTGVGKHTGVVDIAQFCHDGIDNDSNGIKDCNEELCQNKWQGCEWDCRDKKENDGDGKFDLEDQDCNAPVGWDGYSCEDSDGIDAYNPNKKGTAKGSNMYYSTSTLGGPYEIQTDKCKDDKTLIEWMCNTQKEGIEWSEVVCSEWAGEGYKCADGACVKK